MTKQPQSDPHADREACKYDNPIPSREFIMEIIAEAGKPLTRNYLIEKLDLREPEQIEALRRRLRAMERDGQLLYNRRGAYCLIDQTDLVRGRVAGHPDGFGFLIPDEGGDDLFLSDRQMRQVFHGDRVVAYVSGVDRRGRREGSIVEVLERSHTHVVGRFYVEDGIGFIRPDNKRVAQDILVPVDQYGGAQHGQFVTLEVLSYPTVKREAVGKVTEVLGDHMAPGMEIDVAIRSYGLPEKWPQSVLDEIKKFGEQVPEEAKQGREDIRELPLVTIDGEDARDFDDAVFCEPHGKGWRLLVAIADVSAYVENNAPLDVEARERGNSVYFPERVVPMLPEVLSNGLCSINPEVDRLCMVCEMFITAQGAVRKYRFFEGVMRSHARLTYNKVAAMLVDKDKSLRAEYANVLPHVEELHRLYTALDSRRKKRGAIEFDTTETRIVFAEDRKIEKIVPTTRNVAHMMIEECMLAANVSAADYMLTGKIATLYRIHEEPQEKKIEKLKEFLAELGLSLRCRTKPTATHYTKLLSDIQGRVDKHLIQTVMLRSMSQAVYHPDNVGHFGLAYESYAHFTSPIRRYPDLLVHRAIKHLISGKSLNEFVYSKSDMANLGEHCSMTERRADEATRDATDWLKCEYMLDKVEQEFDGIVTSVTGFGLFVEMKDIYIEGLIHITSLADDYFHFDPAKHRLQGERSGISYRLADPVRVRVTRVDLDERKVDFELVPSEADQKALADAPQPKPKRPRRPRKPRHHQTETVAAAVKPDESKPVAPADEGGKPQGKSRPKRKRKPKPKKEKSQD
ncbi:MAG: ribonuclease R [Gammaproteobacteria bacterium]|nr:ribonuclease R [Gammaproteobacteria bacterium]